MPGLSFRPPVRRSGDSIRVEVDAEERALLVRLLDELRQIVMPPTDAGGLDDLDDLDDEARGLVDADVTRRLTPPVYPDDPEREAEYQRLMAEELVSSRLRAIDIVQQALAASKPQFDEEGAVSFMQALNALRLVLGTMIGITEDDEEPEDSPEYELYAYLSWLLEWTVRAL
jgi:hypothetical protein